MRDASIYEAVVCAYVLCPGVIVGIPVEECVAARVVDATVWAPGNRRMEKASLPFAPYPRIRPKLNQM
jgi:hypothetical protein